MSPHPRAVGGRGGRAMCCAGLGLSLLLGALVASAGTDPSAAKCELGILRAYEGDLASAESLFTAVLSASRGDARALTNLGNLALLRGDPEVALGFYDLAILTDTLDGGIRLDRAIALAQSGRESESLAEARAGIRLAGGLREAGDLLGLRPSAPGGEDPPRASLMEMHLTQAEVRALLRASLEVQPPDSSGLGASPGHQRIRSPLRTTIAGARAAALEFEPAASMYWKH